jgi:flagellar hook assembly protein FlgD
VSVEAGQTGETSVAWDGRDAKGELVPLDDYSLVMDFQLQDGEVTTTATTGVTLQWRSQ